MHWVNQAGDRGKWQAVVNTVMNLLAPHKCWKLLNSPGTAV